MCTFLCKLLHLASIDCRFRRTVPHSTIETGVCCRPENKRSLTNRCRNYTWHFFYCSGSEAHRLSSQEIASEIFHTLSCSPPTVMRGPLLWILRRIAIAMKHSSRRMLPHWENEHLAVNVKPRYINHVLVTECEYRACYHTSF
jgi:hypothetical protein